MGKKLPYSLSQSTAELDGTAGDLLKIEGPLGEQYYEWCTKERRAIDLELRAKLVGTTAAIGVTPLVRWRMEIGHGDATYNFPEPQFGIVSGTPALNPILPGRGLVVRLSARKLKIWFRGGTDIGGVPIDSSNVKVSVQPAQAKCCGAEWYSERFVPTGVVAPFPPGATEWRLRDGAGILPLAPATGITLVSVNGGLLTVFAAGMSLIDQWQPIPPLAYAYLSAITSTAYYR